MAQIYTVTYERGGLTGRVLERHDTKHRTKLTEVPTACVCISAEKHLRQYTTCTVHHISDRISRNTSIVDVCSHSSCYLTSTGSGAPALQQLRSGNRFQFGWHTLFQEHKYSSSFSGVFLNMTTLSLWFSLSSLFRCQRCLVNLTAQLLSLICSLVHRWKTMLPSKQNDFISSSAV